VLLLGTHVLVWMGNQEPSNRNNDPFFLYLAFTAQHTPLQGLDEDQAAVSAKNISPDRRKYAAMVRAVDQNVRRGILHRSTT
jgi:arylsulfatase A-like enzyme